MELTSIRRFLCAVALAYCSAALAHSALALATTPRYPISITQARQGDVYAIVAHNKGPAPVSIRLTLSVAENVTTDRVYPAVSMVGPHTAQTLLRVKPASSHLKFRFTTASEQQYGDPAAIPDPDALYRLPFSDGTHTRIAQAFGGTMNTHTGAENRYAVDFAADEGTLVLAARAGIVIDVRDRYVEGRPDPALRLKANSVTILHSDGTLGYYAHLALGALVSIGQRVEAGTPLAHTGNTGFSYGPHLHFAVVRADADSDGRTRHVSVPIKFYNRSPSHTFLPQQDLELTADYAAPPQPTVSPGLASPSPDGAHRTSRASEGRHVGASEIAGD